jgi:hypothetical protein
MRTLLAVLILLGAAGPVTGQQGESERELNARLARQAGGLVAGFWFRIGGSGGYQWLRFGSAIGPTETYRGLRGTAGLTYRFQY